MTMLSVLDEAAATPLVRLTAPAAHPAETFVPDEPPALSSSRRADGWSAANQRAFLEAIAEGHGVDAACGRVGLSVTSAYAFRRTAKGAAFALGWRAATLLARECVAETLLVRALEGQVDTVVRPDGSTYTRHRHDNRLALSLLARLDRQAEAMPDADARAARLVAGEFDAFLALVGRDEGAARAGLFVAARGQVRDDRDLAPLYALAAADRLVRTGVATASDVAVADLDPHERAGWTAEQWCRAEAAGLLALAPEPPAPEKTAPAVQHSQRWDDFDLAELEPDPALDPDNPVWWCEESDAWRTSFPPPPDFAGFEDGRFGDDGYSRALSDAEEAILDGWHAADTAEDRAKGLAARAVFFGLAEAEAVPEAETGPS